MQGSGYIIIQRWKTDNRSNEIIARYKGIEADRGIPWPLEELHEYKSLRIIDGLVHPNDFEFCKKYYEQALSLPFVSHFLYCEKDEVAFVNIPESVQKKFSLVGYDFGYVDEYNIFSSIYHDVINGRYEELRAFSNRLNENLLFSNRADADDLGRIRAEMLEKGADLETIEEGDEIYTIKVHIYSEDLT